MTKYPEPRILQPKTFFETGSHYIAQAGLELRILLPPETSKDFYYEIERIYLW
jgi:hypothetical protein